MAGSHRGHRASLSGGLVALSGHHGGPAPLFRDDPQQWQHFVMGSVVTGGALTEMAGRRAGIGILKLGWPAALATVGWMFFTHAQHGAGEAVERAKRLHQRLGVTLIAAAAGRVASLASDSGAAKLAWPSLLLLGAAQLVTYREPEEAYEAAHL